MDKDRLSQVFGGVWSELMRTPIHLDSLLARQTPRSKSVLAQVLPPILMRPVSLAEAVGVGIPEGQPWSLDPPALANWPAARQVALELHALLERGAVPAPRAMAEDYPPAMRDAILVDWGTPSAERLFAELAKPAPLSLRISRKVDRKLFLDRWKQGGKIPVRMRPSELSPLGLVLESYTPILRTPEYERGEFEIQDEGSQVMSLFTLWPERFAPLLSETPGAAPYSGLNTVPDGNPPAWKVVDACAGAGGKSLALADLMKGQGRLFSYDISAPKLQALRRRATRAGLNNIQAVQVAEGNELQALAKFEKSADRVLVDAPCSGWGVLRRNPDIKWRQSAESLQRFPALQLRLLEAYSTLVAPGGSLVFGTCTFRRAETTEVVEKFLQKHGSTFSKGPGGFLGPGSSDGFFMQSFQRIS
jgi:16S rRNA (cytosine967-C5)-methyltransferase